MVILRTILYYFKKLISFSFFFRITDDANFGTIEKNSQQLRVSLFSLNIGTTIFSIISYGFLVGSPLQPGIIIFPKGFRWFYALRFSEFMEDITPLKHQQLKTSHRTFLETADVNNLSAYKETLLYKVEQMKDTKTHSINKFLAYLAIVVFIIPLYIPSLLKFDSIFEKPIWVQLGYIILSITLIMYFLNLVIFLGIFIKIKAHTRFKYSGIKNDPKPEVSLINGYYLDYQHMKAESTNEVSYMANIENHIFGTIFLSVLLLLFTISVTTNIKQPIAQLTRNSSYQIKTIDLTKSASIVIQSSEIELASLKTDLLNDEIKQILLIRSGEVEKDNYLRVIQIIRSYNVHDIRLTEVQGTSEVEGRLQLIYERR